MADIKSSDSLYIANTYARFPLEIVREKARLPDESGKKYIDLGAGIAVNSFGYADEAWQEAVIAQVKTLQHTSNLYYTQPCVEFRKTLCERTGMRRVFFSNSGAEANECAIKRRAPLLLLEVRRGTAYDHHAENSFHGRTITTLAATGQDSFHTEFGPFTEGFVYATPGDIPELHQPRGRERLRAVMFETVQGEGRRQRASGSVHRGDRKTRPRERYSSSWTKCRPATAAPASSTPSSTTASCRTSSRPRRARRRPAAWRHAAGRKGKDTLTPGTHGSTFGGNPSAARAR